MGRIVAITDDLFFAAKIGETARQVGAELELVRAGDFGAARLAADPPALVIFDLDASSADPIELMRQLKGANELARLPVVGFLRHTHTDIARAAVQAGCDQVMPRSQFVGALAELMRRTLTPAS